MASTEAAGPAAGRAGPAKVLVCDDDETFSDLLEMLLVRDGFEVSKARDGFEALEKLTEEKPDLMLLDIHMPNINGFEILETLSKEPSLHDLSIVVVTGDERKEDRELAERLGAKAVITKPIVCEDLIAAIRKLLPAPANHHAPDQPKP